MCFRRLIPTTKHHRTLLSQVAHTLTRTHTPGPLSQPKPASRPLGRSLVVVDAAVFAGQPHVGQAVAFGPQPLKPPAERSANKRPPGSLPRSRPNLSACRMRPA